MSEGGHRVVVGVGGGIAAYKTAELVRRLTERDDDVTVIPTSSALHFVGAATWEALSGHTASDSVWTGTSEVRHVRLGREADLVVVAPATADLIARAAAGMADDLLAATLLTTTAPVIFAPAMHTEMWENPATQANVALLRERGHTVMEPAVGRLTGADTGKGRMPEAAEIHQVAQVALARRGAGLAHDLAGLRVVVSTGGTREALDPVRFLGNRSSGRQGLALALVAAARGAEVTVVAANVAADGPLGSPMIRVTSARDLHSAVLDLASDADVVVMAAAVADYRPATVAGHKIKRGSGGVPEVLLEENPDVLADLARRRAQGELSSRLTLVGFAAETGDESGSVLDHGRAKLAAKGCDLLVVNEVGESLGFDKPDNGGVILAAGGTAIEVPHGPKAVLASYLWDEVVGQRESLADG